MSVDIVVWSAIALLFICIILWAAFDLLEIKKVEEAYKVFLREEKEDDGNIDEYDFDYSNGDRK
jgi:hypothetical protein